MTTSHRIALLAGATGVVGAHILQALLDDPGVATVHALCRKPLAIQHPKLQVHLVDFAHLPALPAAHEAYLALGTTIKDAGSQDAFRAVDLHMNLAVAQAALAAGARRIGVVSAVDANPGAGAFYNRVKGELEAALKALPLDALVIAQPSLLLDDRRRVGQRTRIGEVIAIPLAKVVAPLLPGRYRPVYGQAVAQALVRALPQATGLRVLPSDVMAQGSQTHAR